MLGPARSSVKVGLVEAGEICTMSLVGIDLRGRDRRSGAIMPGDELHAGAGHLIGDRHGLFRIASVVADGEVKLLAEHAAGSIDVGDGQFCRRSSSARRRWHTDRSSGRRPRLGSCCRRRRRSRRARQSCGQSDEQPGNSGHCHLHMDLAHSLRHSAKRKPLALRAVAPGEGARALVEPAILRDHLRGAHGADSRGREGDAGSHR